MERKSTGELNRRSRYRNGAREKLTPLKSIRWFIMNEVYNVTARKRTQYRGRRKCSGRLKDPLSTGQVEDSRRNFLIKFARYYLSAGLARVKSRNHSCSSYMTFRRTASFTISQLVSHSRARARAISQLWESHKFALLTCGLTFLP